MSSFERSIGWFKSAKILRQGENVCDQAAMNKMKSHILDSLCSVIHLLFDEGKNCRVGQELDCLDMKIFFNTIKRLGEMGLGATQLSTQSETTVKNKNHSREMFPDAYYLIDSAFPNINRTNIYGSELLPLHWAVIVQNDLTTDEVKQAIVREVYKATTYNPQRQLLGHVLASSKSPNMTIVIQLSKTLPRIFHVKDVSNYYPLHYAARYSNENGFVQFLIQQYPEAIQVGGQYDRLPLHCSALNTNENQYKIFMTLLDAYPEAIEMVDVEGKTVLYDAVAGHNASIDIVQAIIARRAELCRAVDVKGRLPLHQHISTSGQPKMPIIRMLVESYSDGLSIADQNGNLPADLAAFYGYIDVVEYLLEQYPPAVNHIGTEHMAASKSVAVSQLICQRYPASLQIVSDRGLLALHDAVWSGFYEQAKLIWAAYPEAITVASTNNGDLPIHLLCFNFKADESNYTDVLSFLVRHHPEGVSTLTNQGRTAYEILCSILPSPIHPHRIILRADPDLDRATYLRMNYAARRQAIFLLFSAVSRDVEPNVLRRLKSSDIELVKVVLSYL